MAYFPRRTLSLIVFFSLALSMGACTHQKVTEVPSGDPQTRVFSAPMDSVWRSVQLATSDYPIQINDPDGAVLETQYIRGEKSWLSPHNKVPPTGGARYKIVVKAIKGAVRSSSDKLPAIQVTVFKRVETQKDFFSTFEVRPSDGFEELSILYRIEREILIDQLIKKKL